MLTTVVFMVLVTAMARGRLKPPLRLKLKLPLLQRLMLMLTMAIMDMEDTDVVLLVIHTDMPAALLAQLLTDIPPMDMDMDLGMAMAMDMDISARDLLSHMVLLLLPTP